MPCNIVVDTSAIGNKMSHFLLKMNYFHGSTFIWCQPVTGELQKHAKSADPEKRQVEVIGAKTLLLMHTTDGVQVVLDYEKPLSKVVDDDLLLRAKRKKAKLLTNDTNQARKAKNAGVEVIFLLDILAQVRDEFPELYASIKPRTAIDPGDMLRVHLLREADDPLDAVARTEDDRLIIVKEGGKDGGKHIGQEVDVRVDKVKPGFIIATLLHKFAFNGATV